MDMWQRAAGTLSGPCYCRTARFNAGKEAEAYNTSAGGFLDLVDMCGWLCSSVGLYRLKARGNKRGAATILVVQAVLLCIANVSNVWVIVNAHNKRKLVFKLDSSDPEQRLHTHCWDCSSPKRPVEK